MINKKCRICGDTFNAKGNSQSKDGYVHKCDDCIALYSKNHTSAEDYYTVYYVPSQHYCGITENIHQRIDQHADKGWDVSDWKVLYCSEDPMDATRKEAEFHLMGMNGMKTELTGKKYRNG